MADARFTLLPAGVSRRLRRAGRRGFTLAELLAVMALMAVMTGVGVLAMRDTASAGIQGSSAEVGSMLAMARELAVTSNRRTRFVVLADSGAIPEAWRLRRYGVLQQTGLASGSPFAVALPFKQLPTGLRFGEDREGEAAAAGLLAARDPIALQGVSADYLYIEFLPTGGTSTPSDSNILAIVRNRPGGSASPQSDANYARLGVVQHTGRVRMERPLGF